MAEDQGQQRQARPRRERVMVEDASGRRPFMRGIMVHSLTARGVPFELALEAADEVRRRIRDLGHVERSELAKLVEEILGSDFIAEHQPPLPAPPLVFVRDRDGELTPFSKGTLSQSLLAAAIDPNDAFAVAQEIEAELLRQGRRETTREELRDLAHGSLIERFGERAAERFLVWRRHQEPQRPVILLLGGTTGSGWASAAWSPRIRSARSCASP